MRKSALIVLCALFLNVTIVYAANPAACGEGQSTECEADSSIESPETTSLGGPEQVENRLHIDAQPGSPMFPSEFAKGYFNWKARIKKDQGVSLGGDYSMVYLAASDSPGKDNAFSGMYRFFGFWEAFNDDAGNSGALIWKAEHRHAFGSNLPAGSLGFEVGYIGLFEPPFSDQQARLTNLYWRQRMKGGDLVFVGGFVDVTDYMDVYMLATPWTGFFNFTFSTGSATIPAPNEGLGLGLGGYVNDNLYIIAGLADSNSDPHRPGDGFDTFFNDHEYFKHFEIGWNSSRDTAFLNNVHLTLWHADERVAAMTPDGWGVNLSWSRSVNEHWMPFVRAGYAEDGGSLLEKSVSTGFSWQTVQGGNQMGLALNWGVPNKSSWGPNLKDQYSVELFYRIPIWKELEVTPDIQFIKDPALNPAEDSLWVFGLRARLAF